MPNACAQIVILINFNNVPRLSGSRIVTKMPIDYSKWDKMTFDTDSDASPLSPAAAAPAARVHEATATSQSAKMSIELERPQQAEGSAWNVSNFHWEEQNLDK